MHVTCRSRYGHSKYSQLQLALPVRVRVRVGVGVRVRIRVRVGVGVRVRVRVSARDLRLKDVLQHLRFHDRLAVVHHDHLWVGGQEVGWRWGGVGGQVGRCVGG